jgi:mannosyltransferase OCH1-like enzyme
MLLVLGIIVVCCCVCFYLCTEFVFTPTSTPTQTQTQASMPKQIQPVTLVPLITTTKTTKTTNATTRTFPGTAVPARVVCTYFAHTEHDLDKTLQESLNSWRSDKTGIKPDIIYYNDTHARAFLAQHFAQEGAAQAWDALVPGAYKADVFRMCEIFVNGGVYCDIKCRRIAPFAALVGSHGTITLERHELGLWNGFFAAPPRAAWVGACITRILANVRNRAYGTSMLDITGPSAMGRSFRAHAGLSDTTTSCEFVRTSDKADKTKDWQQHGESIRILAMRASNSDFFDIVSGPFALQPAFRSGDAAYFATRRNKDPKSCYGHAYSNQLVYAPAG